MTITDPGIEVATTDVVDVVDVDARTRTHGNDRRGARPRLRRSLPAPTRSGGITAAIAALTTVLYTWSLSSVGYAN